MNVVVYTDASCCQVKKIAAVGYMAYNKSICVKQVVRILGGMGIPVSQACELYSIQYALQDCFLLQGVKEISVFTEVKYFFENSSNKERTIVKFPQIKEIRGIIQILKDYGVRVRFVSVKGHGINERNKEIDYWVRDMLRKYRGYSFK